MLPILEFPGVVTRHANHFDSLFHNSQQQQHFREYVSGLILADQATIDAINNLFVERNDQSALNKFVTQAIWNEEELNRRRVQLEVQSLERDRLTAHHGYLIIDDTLTHHVGQHIQLIAKLWDHAEQRYTWAHNLVTSFYVNGAHRFPVNFRLWSQFQEKSSDTYYSHWTEFRKMLTSKPFESQKAKLRDGIRKALYSIGVDKRVADRLISHKNLERITVPIYSKPGTTDSHDFEIARLPDFLRWFEDEFPSGKARWDPDYESEAGEHFSAIRVIFNLQEDDQDARVKVEPTILEEEAYRRKIKEYSYKKADEVKAHTIISTISE